jgi:hypothetical protein
MDTRQIPSFLPNSNHLFLTNNPKHEIGYPKPIRKLKVKLNLVRRSIGQVLHTPQELKSNLQEIVPWAEGEYGVERGDTATTCGEVEKIRIAVLC